jgi:hypothetical protein
LDERVKALGDNKPPEWRFDVVKLAGFKQLHDALRSDAEPTRCCSG